MEKTYKLMKFCGVAGIAIGVIMIVNCKRSKTAGRKETYRVLI